MSSLTSLICISYTEITSNLSRVLTECVLTDSIIKEIFGLFPSLSRYSLKLTVLAYSIEFINGLSQNVLTRLNEYEQTRFKSFHTVLSRTTFTGVYGS